MDEFLLIAGTLLLASGVVGLLLMVLNLINGADPESDSGYQEFGTVTSVTHPHNDAARMTVRCHGMYFSAEPGTKVYYKREDPLR